MSGRWILVCGPSGAGKDSVIAWAQAQLPGHPSIVFAQRISTRPAPIGRTHRGVTEDAFDRLLRDGALAWHWRAHGFRYGIASRYALQVGWGRLVVVNGSREHAAGLAPDPSVGIVLVEASADRLAQRLAQRAREAPEAIASRLERNQQSEPVAAELTIGNNGELAGAGQRLLDFLEAQLRRKYESAVRPSDARQD